MSYDIKEISYPLSNGEIITLNNQAISAITHNNPNITTQEVLMFIELCKYQKLNPFIGEAHLIKYKKEGDAQCVVSYNAYMRKADEHPAYDGIESGIIVQENNGNITDRVGCVKYPNELLLGGWAKVYRKDRRIPFVSRVDLKEYNTQQSMWGKAPSLMINKVAKAQCLRQAFPSAFNGMYIEEEMGQRQETAEPIAPIQQSYDMPFETTETIEVTPTDITNNNGFIMDDDIDSPDEEPNLDIVLTRELKVGEIGRVDYRVYRDDRNTHSSVEDRCYKAMRNENGETSYRESDKSIILKRIK